MADKITRLKTKFEGCDYCGSPAEHAGAFQCPRIKSVTWDEVGYTVEFREPKEDTDGDSDD